MEQWEDPPEDHRAAYRFVIQILRFNSGETTCLSDTTCLTQV